MSLGTKIREARKKRKFTQTKLGDKIGVSNKVISKWEKDIAKPKMPALKKLTKALGVDDNYFIPLQKHAIYLLVYKAIKKEKIVYEYDEWQKKYKYGNVDVDLINNDIFEENASTLSQKDIDEKYFLYKLDEGKTCVIKKDFKEIVDGKEYAVILDGELSIEKVFNDEKNGFFLIRIDNDKITEIIANGITTKKLFEEIEKNNFIEKINFRPKEKNIIAGVVISTVNKIK